MFSRCNIIILQVTYPIDESTFLSDDLHLLESVEFKQRTKHIVEIIEEIKWQDVDPDLLTRFVNRNFYCYLFFPLTFVQ